MRRAVLSFSILLLVISSFPNVQSTEKPKTPPWFREGTYLKYTMMMPTNPKNGEVNVIEVWPRLLPSQDVLKSVIGDLSDSSTVTLLVYGDMYLAIKITNITNDTAYVQIALELNNVSPRPGITIPQLSLNRTLLLNLTDMVYYEEDGTPIGRPMFFVDPMRLPKEDDYLVFPAFLKKHGIVSDKITIRNVSYTWMENKVLHTHYKDFMPPYLYVDGRGRYLVYNRKTGESFDIITQLVYDIDTSILITTGVCDITPELVSLGIVKMIALDRVNSRKLEKLIEEGKADKEWYAQGFNLYDTNIKLHDYGSGRSPSTPVKYFFALSLVVLAMTALWTERRWKW
ncbi:hypothetical protein APY94_11365 [Thermococcus celericrescens]|uniref:Uncharacterized protein n=1 Tax=Thermococcus celericrescens TaxID=227598 RepID=A0A124EB06_9EURY|nr:hypothetical protein [Thermococcus celericrescens]KUH31913.1 hypothetical protein APY94_11365 [Thermococcus celericrescens]